MTVVGVDGWRGRWVAALADGRRLTWQVHDDFGAVLREHPGTVVAVDMPVGTTDGPREADLAARRFLAEHGGTPSSVFLTPPTAVVAAWEAGRTHAEAMAARGDAPGTSIQAWNLVPSMVQVRDAVSAVPGATVVEAHPECSFRALDERVGRASKKTGRGAGLRLRALTSVLDVDLADAPPDVPVDDLLDAAVLTWTAGRVARGEHLVLPDGATGAPRIVV